MYTVQIEKLIYLRILFKNPTLSNNFQNCFPVHESVHRNESSGSVGVQGGTFLEVDEKIF
jgi:hypothetical protein